MSSSGGIDTAIDRIAAIGGDCVQVFTQSPRMWRPTAHSEERIAAFREKRAANGIGGVVCHALYLCNLAAPDDAIYEKSVATMRNTVDAACAIGADGVIFHVGSHLGAGFEAGLERTCAALAQILERCDGDTWLLMENSAGAGGTIGRSLEELATLLERLDGHPRLGVCLDSCHLYVSGYDVTDARVGRRAGGRAGLAHRARPPARAARQRLRCAARLEPRPAREHPRGTSWAKDSARSWRIPRSSTSPRTSRCRARTRQGPSADELQKLRDLHARWTA